MFTDEHTEWTDDIKPVKDSIDGCLGCLLWCAVIGFVLLLIGSIIVGLTLC